jgi:hypothetical protein
MEISGKVKVINPVQQISESFKKENWLLLPKNNIRNI